MSKTSIEDTTRSFSVTVQSRICYRPPMKLREGNVFTHVRLTVHRGIHVTITHDILKLTIRPQDIGPHCTGIPHPKLTSLTSAYRDSPFSCEWHLLTITWDLFKLVNFRPTHPLTSADIWWLLKHVQSVQGGGTNHTGMLSGWIM